MPQYRVYEGTNENKRQGNKNAKKYHEFFCIMPGHLTLVIRGRFGNVPSLNLDN